MAVTAPSLGLDRTDVDKVLHNEPVSVTDLQGPRARFHRYQLLLANDHIVTIVRSNADDLWRIRDDGIAPSRTNQKNR